MKRKAISIANHSSEQVILGVYQNLINKHNTFCSCDYCQLLKRYVGEKKSLSRFKRVDYEFYSIHPQDLSGDFGTNSSFYKEVERRKDSIKNLKQKKDSIKAQVLKGFL